MQRHVAGTKKNLLLTENYFFLKLSEGIFYTV